MKKVIIKQTTENFLRSLVEEYINDGFELLGFSYTGRIQCEDSLHGVVVLFSKDEDQEKTSINYVFSSTKQ